MKNIVFPFLIISFVVAGCSSKTHVAHNYYDDGIYHDGSSTEYQPITDNAEDFELNDIKEPAKSSEPENKDDLNYYDPSDNSADNYRRATTTTTTTGATTVINNNYYGPSFRNPGYNTGLYWNNWGGWGVSVGYGWGGYGYYDPWCYDPFFDPYYYSWGPRCHPYAYQPWRTYGYGYGGWYGYNSYWAGYYDGYYYGGGFDGYGGTRNITYVRNINTATRSGSFNSINRSRVNKNGNGGSGRTYSRNISDVDINRDRKASARREAPATRFADRNLSRSIESDRSDIRNFTASRTSESRPIDKNSISSSAYRSDSYEYVRNRTTGKTDRSVINTERIDRAREAAERGRSRVPTRSYSKEDYSRSRTTDDNDSRSRSRDIYVPSNTRSRQYDNSRNSTPSRERSYTPSRSNERERSYTPSRSNTRDRSYTPSRSRDTSPSYDRGNSRSRSYTPSRSSGNSRSYTPSRSSGSSRSSAPSRSSSRSRSR